MKDLDTLKGIAEQEVDGVKVGLDVGSLRHQVDRIQEQPKLHDNTVIITGSVLTTWIFLMIIVFCREKIMLKIRTQVNRRRKPTPAERCGPGISSDELLVGNDEPRGEIEVKTPDRNGSSPSVLYHKGIN